MHDHPAWPVVLPKAVIIGHSGTHLAADNRRLYRDLDPAGFILFADNCQDPGQVRTLVAELRDAVGRADAPVLIDQEGGRIARLRPPHWRVAPPPMTFAHLAKKDPERAREAAWVNARLLALELHDLGITVNCTPLLDLSQPGADPIIGDRASGGEIEHAINLGRATCEGLLSGGVLPVLKHIPGHGRATLDSHKALPVIDAPLEDLESVDFAPFKALAHFPWAMTAHALYTAVDRSFPATISSKVINKIIRGAIGFGGVLISDDLAMEALEGSLPERAQAALEGGCDLALYCNSQKRPLSAVAAVVEACAPLTPAAARRLAQAEKMRQAAFEPAAEEALSARFKTLMRDS